MDNPANIRVQWILILAVIAMATGCTSSYSVTSGEPTSSGTITLAELNSRLEGKTVQIERRIGTIDTATHVDVRRDMTRAIALTSRDTFQMPTSSITRLTYRSGTAGFLGGMLLGTLGGGVLGVGIAAVLSPPPYHGLEALGLFLGGGVGSALGLLGGAVYGANEGKPYIFEMGTSEQWQYDGHMVEGRDQRMDAAVDSSGDGVSITLGPTPEINRPTVTPNTQALPLDRWWASGAGGLMGNLDGQSSWGVFYQLGDWTLSLRTYSAENYFVMSESEWQGMIGRSHEGEFHRLSWSGGLSIVKGNITDRDFMGGGTSRDFVAIGVPLEVRGIAKFTDNLGIGVCVFYNYNPRKSSNGILFVVELGQISGSITHDPPR